METITCRKCGKELPIDAFTKNKSKKNGINTWCRKCTSDYKALYRTEHSEEIRKAKQKCYYAKKEKYQKRFKENYLKTRWTQVNPFCSEYEKVENYEKAKADNFIGWDRHHRLETHNSDGEKRLIFITPEELIALDMYYNRPPEELIWLKHTDHSSLHHKGKNERIRNSKARNTLNS